MIRRPLAVNRNRHVAGHRILGDGPIAARQLGDDMRFGLGLLRRRERRQRDHRGALAGGLVEGRALETNLLRFCPLTGAMLILTGTANLSRRVRQSLAHVAEPEMSAFSLIDDDPTAIILHQCRHR